MVFIYIVYQRETEKEQGWKYCIKASLLIFLNTLAFYLLWYRSNIPIIEFSVLIFMLFT